MKNITIIAAALFMLTVSCKPQKKIAGNYSYESECMGTELDGSQTMKVWGSGKNRIDAVEQAKKNGVRDVLFKGILKGQQGCNQKPVIFEVNAQEKYELYFNKFFADGGPYLQFVSMKDESVIPAIKKDKKRAQSEVTEGVIVRILRAELKQKMITDQIIKQ